MSYDFTGSGGGGPDGSLIKRSVGRRMDLYELGAMISRSNSGQSAFPLSSSPSGGLLGSARRRSTETTGSGGGLDNYYWSTAAGVGTSSSSSSLAHSMSASPSNGGGLVEAGDKRKGLYRRSEASLRDLIAQEQRREGGLMEERASGAVDLESPTWSGESDYSSSYSESRDGGRRRQINGDKRNIEEPTIVWSEGDNGSTPDFARQSMTSNHTATPGYNSRDGEEEGQMEHRTPLAVQRERAPGPGKGGFNQDTRAPEYVYATESLHATPIVAQTDFKRSQPSPSSYTPGSGRLDSAGVRRGGSSPVYPVLEGGNEPQSAPAWQADFGLGMGSVGEDETTIKERGRDKRSTLPAAMPDTAPGGYLSPEKGQRGSGSPQPPPRSALRTQLAGISSPLPNLALDYKQPPITTRVTHSPLNISPPTQSLGRLSLSSSPSSTSMSRESSNQPGSQSSDALSPGESSNSGQLQSPPSINDLTDLLGGAIDEIGLIDSRDTPPPMVTADRRDKARPSQLSIPVTAIQNAEEESRRPITPRSLPNRGESLSSIESGMVPPPNQPTGTPIPDENRFVAVLASNTTNHQRQTSASTLHAPSSSSGTFATRPWPAAMLFGHIKNMKHSGDRAKYYAKAINELAAADSGIRDWCVISASSVHRVPPARAPINRLQSNKSMSSRTDFAPSIHIQPALPSSLTSSRGGSSSHPRTVSSSSEFPMREDSYSAREISQRIIDPSDEPTSLPPNLPYPQLQQVRQGGMRSSPSVASMASMASNSTASGERGNSSKRGFFSALRNKKDGSSGLGPPTGPIPREGSGVGKKDIRGIQISNPERTNSSSPMGPRGPRMGSVASDNTPERPSIDNNTPYRSSLDTSISRLTPSPSAGPGRASFDSGPTNGQNRSNVGSRLQQAVTASSVPTGVPSEDEVRSMQEVLPHVDRGVLRGYLMRHGDQMTAITAYFEDEKRGAVRN